MNTYVANAQAPVFKCVPGGGSTQGEDVYVGGGGGHFWVGWSVCGLPLPQLVINSGSGRDILLESFRDIPKMFLN